jgi:hypothetical protein
VGAGEEGEEGEMNPQILQTVGSLAGLFAAMGAFLGGMYLVVTRPLLKRMDDIVARLARIEDKLDDHTERIVRLEERAGLVKPAR